MFSYGKLFSKCSSSCKYFPQMCFRMINFYPQVQYLLIDHTLWSFSVASSMMMVSTHQQRVWPGSLHSWMVIETPFQCCSRNVKSYKAQCSVTLRHYFKAALLDCRGTFSLNTADLKKDHQRLNCLPFSSPFPPWTLYLRRPLPFRMQAVSSSNSPSPSCSCCFLLFVQLLDGCGKT